MAVANEFLEQCQQAMAGNRQAQAELWDQFLPCLRRIVRFKLLDLKLARTIEPDEVCNEFFLKFFRPRSHIKFTDVGHFKNYVEKSVRRFTVRFSRRQGTGLKELRLDECSVATVSPSYSDAAIDGVDWDDYFETIGLHLSERERSILALVRIGYCWREVGEQLDLAPDTARITHQRSVAKVRATAIGWAGQLDVVDGPATGDESYLGIRAIARHAPQKKRYVCIGE